MILRGFLKHAYNIMKFFTSNSCICKVLQEMLTYLQKIDVNTCAESGFAVGCGGVRWGTVVISS